MMNNKKLFSVGIGLIGSACATSLMAQSPNASFLRNGEMDFVVSHIKFALATNMDDINACPNGVSLNISDIFALTPEGKRRAGESETDYSTRLQQVGRAQLGSGDDNHCLHPEKAKKEPHFKRLVNTQVTSEGVDLDHKNSADDFADGKGNHGIDNQFLRVVGCSHSFMPGGMSNSFEIEMHAGSWGILFELSGVDDLQNDDQIQVRILANADPIQLSPKREPLAYASYAYDHQPAFVAQTTGRLVDGVLTTEPVDMQFHNVTNSMWTKRILNSGVIRAKIDETGRLSGVLAGYTPVESAYDLSFGYRSAEKPLGQLAPEALRMHTANGSSFVLGYTCAGVYQALVDLADGDWQEEQQGYTSISTQYLIEAIPAFVVEEETQSVNQTLANSGGAGNE